jgi:NHS family xanthosine MFS transporter
LSNSISFTIKLNNKDLIKFSTNTVWGTIGFIAAMWITNLTGNKATAYQFYIAGLSFFLDFIRLLTKCKPSDCLKNASLMETLGLESFKFFADYKMALFFIFSMF